MRTTMRRPSAMLLLVLGLLLLAAALVGAYLDWMWWHPTKGILITLVAIGALVLAGVLRALRRPIASRAALGALAIGAGLLIGQAVGPSREPPQLATGSMTMRLDGPVDSEVTSRADCQTVASGDQLQISGDINGRLPLDGMDPREYPFVSASVSSGDMWAPDFGRRDDELSVSLYFNAAVETAGLPTELRLHSVPASSLDARIEGNSGTVEFSGLVVLEGDLEAILGADGDVTGVLEWSCPG